MSEKNENNDLEILECPHKNIIKEGGYVVCGDCGLILGKDLASENSYASLDYFTDSQRDYERKIRLRDSRAKQNPKIKQKYDKIKTLEKWFQDYETRFTEQKKTIELLRSYGIGLNIDSVKLQEIKERYLRYNRKHKKSYENMVIIFLTILWLEIKDTTNIRLEEFIDVCNELGHKINKKMLNNAMLKVLKAEDKWKETDSIDLEDIETQIKNKIKIVFQKNLNDLSYQSIDEYFSEKAEFNKLKIEMQLILHKILNQIKYEQIQNLNYKAFSAGLIYYIGQLLPKKYQKIFTQNLVKDITNYSETTIRKKYHLLIKILGTPENVEIRL